MEHVKSELIGYAPDVSPLIPGVLTACAAMVPSTKGMKGAPSASTVTALPALAAACAGAGVMRKLDSTTRVFAGTSTKLYEAGSSSWTDRTRASGGDYSLGTGIRWRFAQFGDVSLAASKSEILQSTTTGAFANVGATVPKAAIVETFENFVLLCDVNDHGGLYDGLDRPHGWWVAARGGHTDWTPSITTECATGQLSSSPGKIFAARRFGQSCVVYKERAMYILSYAGQPNIIDVLEVPGSAGAVSQECVVVVGTAEDPRHIFMGHDNFYSFDGSRPQPIGNPLKETVFNELDRDFSYACQALHDPINNLIYFFYPTSASTNPDKCVVYNYKTGKWGRDDRTIEAVVEYISAGLSYDDFGTIYATFADTPNLTFDAAFFSSGTAIPSVFNSSHRLQTLNGVAGTGSITTGDFGSDDYVTFVSRLRPAFLTRPDSATLTPYYKMSLGDSYTQDSSVAMTSGKFDFRRSAKWHRFGLEFIGAVEIPFLTIDAMQEGED